MKRALLLAVAAVIAAACAYVAAAHARGSLRSAVPEARATTVSLDVADENTSSAPAPASMRLCRYYGVNWADP